MLRGRPRKVQTEKVSVNMEMRKAARDKGRQQLREELQIGQRLRQIRTEHHLTQEEVAAMLTLNRTAYTHYENELNMPDILTLVQLAQIYDIPRDEFMRMLTAS